MRPSSFNAAERDVIAPGLPSCRLGRVSDVFVDRRRRRDVLAVWLGRTTTQNLRGNKVPYRQGRF